MYNYPNPAAENMYPGPYAGNMPEQNAGHVRPLAMAYVRPQGRICDVFSPGDALMHGTLFPELYKPFIGKRGTVL